MEGIKLVFKHKFQTVDKRNKQRKKIKEVW